MFNFFIWLRGVIANNLGISAAIIWIIVIAILAAAIVKLVKIGRSGKPMSRGWKTFFVSILVANLVFFQFSGWMVLLMASGVEYYLSSHGLGDAWVVLVYGAGFVSLAITVVGLLMFIWTNKLSKRRTIALGILFSLAFLELMAKAFFMGGFTLFVYQRTLWPGVRRAMELNMDVRNIVTLPRDKKQLKQFFPEKVREIENYGTLCYFYDEKNDNYLIMTRMAERYAVYNREYEWVVVNENDEKWQEWIERCG